MFPFYISKNNHLRFSEVSREYKIETFGVKWVTIKHCIHPECGKMRTRKTSNTDIFHAVTYDFKNFFKQHSSSYFLLTLSNLSRFKTNVSYLSFNTVWKIAIGIPFLWLARICFLSCGN